MLIMLIASLTLPPMTIDFDFYPDGSPVIEGTILTDQYSDAGVIFSVADTLFPPGVLVIEDASGRAAYSGFMSQPNILSSNGYVPGPGSGVGCNTDQRVDFVDPVTLESMTVTTVSIQVFQTTSSGGPLSLIARNVAGEIVDQDSHTGGGLYVLAVSNPRIASIETEGATGNDGCFAIDNLTFSSRCLWDISGDDLIVNAVDLLLLLMAWGPNPDHPADIISDGNVNVTDLLDLLGAWGACP